MSVTDSVCTTNELCEMLCVPLEMLSSLIITLTHISSIELNTLLGSPLYELRFTKSVSSQFDESV